MVRTQIRLTAEQIEALRRLGVQRHRSMAELIRESVDQMLERSDRAARAQRFLKVAGQFSSDLHDVSVNHDKYLAEDFAD
jgi:Arc/MetJ-type ribon-helix-helix transcriptional regulator